MTRSNAPAYMTGFGNHFATEAAPGALPQGQNSPQKTPMGLYAEQLSGTAFTAPRAENRRSWLYRLRPSAQARTLSAVRPGPGALGAVRRDAAQSQPDALGPAADA